MPLTRIYIEMNIILDFKTSLVEIEGRWNELGDWDCHIHTVGTMYKIKKLMRTYCVAQGTLFNAFW